MISTQTTLPVALFKGAIGISVLIIPRNWNLYRTLISLFPAGYREKKKGAKVYKCVILPCEWSYRLVLIQRYLLFKHQHF